MSLKKPEPKRPLAEVIRENWSDQLELGGSTSSFGTVATSGLT